MIVTGRDIKIMREAAGLNVSQLARKAGISVPTLVYIEEETGGRLPRQDTVERILSVFGKQMVMVDKERV